MLFLSVATCALAAIVSAAPQLVHRQQELEPLADFIATQRSVSLTGVLANIGGLNSSWVVGADPGIVVASPSTVHPNYFYTWTRDAALTYMMIIDELYFGNTSLRATIEDYTQAQAVLQTVTNPSGSLWPAGDGLGEAKYYTNKTRFDGTWGRPQRDGPALRATAFMNLAHMLMESNETEIVREVYWPLILNDLKYVGQYWNQTGYELWEEVHGSSFFTLNAQHRALVQGALLAREIDVPCRPCEQAPQILCMLQHSFWNASGNYITADVNVNNVNRSGINASPLLASILVFDANATCNTSDFQPCNSQILATHKVVVDSFRNRYPLNNNATAPEAVLIGRYPEDTYFEGSPWPICTLGAAELLYDAVFQFNKSGSITIDEYSLGFFQDIYPDAAEQTYTGSEMNNILDAMTTYADGFVTALQPSTDTEQRYVPANGSLSEQINQTTGEMTSASKLTWSFAAFVTMAERRAGQQPPSWGAWTDVANTNLSSGHCNGTSWNSTGTYRPALAAGAPNISTPCSSEVIFSVNASTSFGQNIYLAGNVTKLGNSLNNASQIILPLNPGNYTWNNPEWYVDIWLAAGVTVEYRYALQYSNQTYEFENRTTPRFLTAGGCGSGKVVRNNDVAHFTGQQSSG